MKALLPLRAALSFVICLTLAPVATAQLADTSLWKVNLGQEMPGAAATEETGSDGSIDYVGLDYDFTNGGGYVALVNSSPIIDPFKEFRFQVFIDTPHRVAVRLVDSQGEVFQYTFDSVAPGEWSDQPIKLSEDPTSRYLASEQSTGNEKIDFPIVQVWLLMENNQREDPVGKVKFRKIELK